MVNLKKLCIQCGIEFSRSSRRNIKWWNKAKFCSYACKGLAMRNKPRISKMTVESIRKIRQKAIGRPSPLKGRIYKLKAKSELKTRIRFSYKYRQWRSDVFTRDNFTCQWCGDKRGGQLNADHIKPFFILLQEYEIVDYVQALNCEPLWNINNGRTLCEDCHKTTTSYGNKPKGYLYQLDLI